MSRKVIYSGAALRFYYAWGNYRQVVDPTLDWVLATVLVTHVAAVKL